MSEQTECAVTPKLYRGKLEKPDINTLSGMRLKAVVNFPGQPTIIIPMNEYLHNYFRQHATRTIAEISRRLFALLSNMPPVTTADLENYGGVYYFSDEYMSAWLNPITRAL